MIIYTDDTAIARNFLWQPVIWQPTAIKHITDDSNFLAQALFNLQNIYQANIQPIGDWKYLFIVKHAISSHFELLSNLCRQDKQLPGNMLLIAASGEKFRGFHNRSWVSIPGNLHLSVFLTPRCKIAHFHVGFTIIAAISVIQALDTVRTLKGRSWIKWVNDIVIQDSKVGGVITQTQVQDEVVMAAILGIGLNVQQTPHFASDIFVPKAGCLWDFTGAGNACTQTAMFYKLIQYLAKNYNLLVHNKYDQLREFYLKRSLVIGKVVEIYSDLREGDPVLLSRGKVKAIGQNLELYLQGIKNPIYQGRLVIPAY